MAAKAPYDRHILTKVHSDVGRGRCSFPSFSLVTKILSAQNSPSRVPFRFTLLILGHMTLPVLQGKLWEWEPPFSASVVGTGFANYWSFYISSVIIKVIPCSLVPSPYRSCVVSSLSATHFPPQPLCISNKGLISISWLAWAVACLRTLAYAVSSARNALDPAPLFSLFFLFF